MQKPTINNRRRKENVENRLKEAFSDNDNWHGLVDRDDPTLGYWVDIASIAAIAVTEMENLCANEAENFVAA